MGNRYKIAVNTGNLLELAGAACVVYGIDRLVGLSWALIAAGILLVVAAELIYDEDVKRIPLPHKPRPRVRAKEWRQAFALQMPRLRRMRTAALARLPPKGN